MLVKEMTKSMPFLLISYLHFWFGVSKTSTEVSVFLFYRDHHAADRVLLPFPSGKKGNSLSFPELGLVGMNY